MWKALRIADPTRLLPQDAAGFVDAQLAPYAHGCSWAQVDRLVEEALVRFDPAAAEERRREAQDHRHVDLGLDQIGYDGIAHGTTALDAADALDLEQAIARRAKLNGQLGDEDSLDVRRAKALGEIAREDLILDLRGRRPRHRGDHPHHPGSQDRAHPPPVRDRPDRGPVREHPHPDLGRADQAHGSAWPNTVGDRPAGPRPGRPPAGGLLRDPRPDPPARSNLRDHHCVFPHCTRPAESCDLDHIEPHAEGGATCACNLAPLCRGHHRLKTADRASLPDAHPRHLPLDPARPGPTWSTPPAPTSSPGRQHPTRPRSSYPAPHPATGGATGMSGVSIRPRAERSGSTTAVATVSRNRPRPRRPSQPQPQRAPQTTPSPGRARGTAP